MPCFFDTHLHFMTLNEPDFPAYVSPFGESPVSFLTANLTKDYILSNRQTMVSDIMNTLIAFSQSILDTMLMLEKDLEGAYRNERNRGSYPDEPYLRDGLFHYRESEYDQLVLCPLVMDFTHPESSFVNTYYPVSKADRLSRYLDDTADAIKEFRKRRKDSIITFAPFAGINPPAHDFEYIEKFLQTRIAADRNPSASEGFYGIKLYPPLGTDPWPEDESELKKMRLIYSFCQDRGIPVITHCDDQGFRGVSARKAWEYTNPASWRTVLENYPGLIIDFAHVGRQYGLLNVSTGILDSFNARLRKQPANEWFYSLMALIKDFDNVYSDISFTGAYPEFYEETSNYLKTLSDNERDKIESRLMMGSDFAINLLKAESYSSYLHVLEESRFSDELTGKIVSENPQRFLHLDLRPVKGSLSCGTGSDSSHRRAGSMSRNGLLTRNRKQDRSR